MKTRITAITQDEHAENLKSWRSSTLRSSTCFHSTSLKKACSLISSTLKKWKEKFCFNILERKTYHTVTNVLKHAIRLSPKWRNYSPVPLLMAMENVTHFHDIQVLVIHHVVKSRLVMISYFRWIHLGIWYPIKQKTYPQAFLL